MAAHESAKFARWSAASNIANDVLDLMDSDIVDLAQRYPVDPLAAAQFDLANAHLASGDLDAFGEHARQGMCTADHYRTVPVIKRAGELRSSVTHGATITAQRSAIADDLANLCFSPAPAPHEPPVINEPPMPL